MTSVLTQSHNIDAGGIDTAYLEAGSGEPVLMLHGEPSWSYLYRTMIPVLVEAGHRCIAPDLVGFGRREMKMLAYLAQPDQRLAGTSRNASR